MTKLRDLYDPAKVADLVAPAIVALEGFDRERLEAAVDETGGFMHVMDFNDDGTVTIKVAGIPLMTVEAWRIAPDAAMGPAHRA